MVAKTTRARFAVSRLRWVATFFRQNPHALNMYQWLRHSESCGTVGCIAGWSALKYHEVEVWALGLPRADYDYPSALQRLARRALRINKEQGYRLFIVRNWPFFYRREYERVCGSELLQEPHRAAALADITARRIEHFIETRGRE